MTTLVQTSPMMKGPEVRALQTLLRQNWTGQDFMQGVVDGEFGPETARACVRAKYWLGYPEDAQRPTAGDALIEFLEKKASLTAEMQQRRRQRLEQARRQPLRLKALAEAARDVGMVESPANSNRCRISEDWGLIGPWCAMAVSTWYVRAGSQAFRKGADWAYVPYLLSAAEHASADGLALTRVPNPGDIVCFDWDRDGVPDHTGLVSEWRGGPFTTIEGNTSSGTAGSQSNGGGCYRRSRDLRDVARFNGAPAFVHVGR
jgi:CHAP domain